jgi:polysaccharide export outer membrane protein
MGRIACRVTLACLLGVSVWGQVPQPTVPAPKEEQRKGPDLAPATQPTAEEAAEKAKASTGLPVAATAAPVDPKTYVIGAEDILMIRVWRENELSSGVQVRPDGKITLPLIGELQAAGLTPEALKAKVVEALSEYINKPEVIVSLQSVQSKKYYITGEVARSGTFSLVVPTTILEALTNTGGFREFANPKKITILRQGKIIKFNYNDVIKGKNLDQNILLESGDYIIVP